MFSITLKLRILLLMKMHHNTESKASGAPQTSIPRIIKHGVKSPSKIRPNSKKECNKLDEFDLGVVRRMMHQFYARNESLASIYYFSAEISSIICKN